MNEIWGLTERGFRRPNYLEILDALEYKARELFGSGINLKLGSVFGIFMRLFAWMLNLLFQLTEDVYNSRFVDTAVGTSLYNVGKAIGLRLLSAQKAVGYLKITGKPGTRIPSGFLAATVSGTRYVVLSDMQIGEDGTALVPIQAFEAGPGGNAEPETIREIINPVPGISSVINPKKVDGGRNRETDEEFRDRYYKSVDFAGGVNIDAIRGELLQTVEGVYSALVYENYTDETDSEGLPPHSIEPVVYGGLDADVAQAIMRRKAAGIQTHGNVTVPAVTISGQAIEIKFSRPQPVPVWIRISHLSTSAVFPIDGHIQIKNALIDYIGGDAQGGLGIGSPLVYNRLPAIIYTVSGVVDFDLEISADGLSYSTENITVQSRQKATTNAEKVNFV